MSLGIGVHTFAENTSGLTVTTGGITTAASGSGIYLFCVFDKFTSQVFSSVTDNKGNSANYVQVGAEIVSTDSSVMARVYYCPNATGGAGHTATLTVTGSNGSLDLYIVEITTTNGAGITIDQATQNTDNTTPFTSSSITTTVANTMLMGGMSENASTSVTHTAGNSFAVIDEETTANAWSGASSWRLVSATGTYNTSWTVTGTVSTSVQTIASFSEVAGGAAARVPQSRPFPYKPGSPPGLR